MTYLKSDKVQVSRVHGDLSQEVICTTQDRLWKRLTQYIKRAEASRDWMAPGGVVLAISMTLVTCEFRHVGLSADSWKAVFWIVLVAAFVWLVVTLLKLYRRMSIEELIDRIKAGSDDIED